MQAHERLRAWREKMGISQGLAAEAAGVRQNTWSDWEHGRKIPQGRFLGIIELVTSGAVPVSAWAGVPASARARIARVLKSA